VAPNSLLEELSEVVGSLRGLRPRYLSATPYGGAVAELLRSIVPLLNDLGLRVAEPSVLVRVFEEPGDGSGAVVDVIGVDQVAADALGLRLAANACASSSCSPGCCSTNCPCCASSPTSRNHPAQAGLQPASR